MAPVRATSPAARRKATVRVSHRDWVGSNLVARQARALTSLVLATGGSVHRDLDRSRSGSRRGIGGGLILPIGQLKVASAPGPRRMGRVVSSSRSRRRRRRSSPPPPGVGSPITRAGA
jgi:hypothetical protein